VEVRLPGGLAIRVHGRIDRIDELTTGESACYAVWDYKTGSTYGYERDDPVRQGRHIQHALYLELANARLAEVRPGARVVRFGYFFPGVRAHGERLAWEEAELAGAGPILARLCRMIASGCFPFTDDPGGDLRFSDYTAAFGDLDSTAWDITRKLENRGNKALRPFRELREYDEALEVTEE
jgi:ATP-dependent helicase/nuclease subunit B